MKHKLTQIHAIHAIHAIHIHPFAEAQKRAQQGEVSIGRPGGVPLVAERIRRYVQDSRCEGKNWEPNGDPYTKKSIEQELLAAADERQHLVSNTASTLTLHHRHQPLFQLHAFCAEFEV